MKHGVRLQLAAQGSKSQQGFSLFELIVYMLVSSILFAAAFNRYQAYPAEAERANFTAILGQLKTGVNIKMITAVASGSISERNALAGSNPMDLMLQTPANYLGALDNPDESTLPRRIWYFNNQAGELVYLADRSDNLYSLGQQGRVPTSRISLHVVDIIDEAEGLRPRWQGVALEPVEPYEWLSTPLEIVEPEPPEVPELDNRLLELVDSQL